MTSIGIPDQVASKLRAADLGVAVENLEGWIAEQRLAIAKVETRKIPTYQVVVPMGARSHPLLTLQPPPNNPDVPLQKMRGLPGSPYSNGASRQGIVEQLNAQLPESEQKPSSYRDEFYKINWRHFADPAQFARIRSVLDRIVTRVRAA